MSGNFIPRVIGTRVCVKSLNYGDKNYGKTGTIIGTMEDFVIVLFDRGFFRDGYLWPAGVIHIDDLLLCEK